MAGSAPERGYREAGIEALIEDHLTEGRRSVLLSRERPAGHCPHLLADACRGPLQDIDAATAAVAIERVLVGCDRRHLYAAQERRDRGEPMTSEDLQAHYRTELARMLGPEGGRYVNPKTTAWMLKHTAATEGGTYTPETGARTWIWSDLHLHHKNIIRYCNRPFQSVEAITGQLLVRLVSLRTVIDIDLPTSRRRSLSFAAWHAWGAARLFPSVSLAGASFVSAEFSHTVRLYKCVVGDVLLSAAWTLSSPRDRGFCG